VTTLDNVIALPGNVLRYNYTITKANTDDLDTTLLLTSSKQGMINTIRANPNRAYFHENNIDIIVSYSDHNGAHLCKVLISHNEY
jgi:hypothetical protein